MRSWQVALAAFLLMAGFLGVAQWRAGRPMRAQAELPSRRAEQLAVLLRQQEEARRALEAEVRILRTRVRAFQEAVAQGQGAYGTMTQDMAALRLTLGLTAVEGPGVVVRLSSGGTPGGVLAVQIRAADLAGLVNELWSAGAEAVAVNGRRIVASTGFRDQDGVIAVGPTPQRPPFTIAAIGEPLVLQTALGVRGGFVEGLRSIGLQVVVKRKTDLRLAGYAGSPPFRRARPVRERP